MYYNESKERFKEFSDKIIHVIDDGRYDNALGIPLNHKRQGSAVLMDIFKDCNDDDFLVVCDGDAIVKKEAFDYADLTKRNIFSVEWCSYWINAYFPGWDFEWVFSAPISLFRKFGSLYKVSWCREDSNVINNSGWHWSKLGGVDKVIENIKGHPHQDLAKNKRLIDPELVQYRIDRMISWSDPLHNGNPDPNRWEHKFRKFDPDFYPKYISERMDIFSKYIKEVE